MIKRYFADESGATAIEYSFVAGMMLLVVISIAATGGSLGALYERVGLISVATGGGGGA